MCSRMRIEENSKRTRIMEAKLPSVIDFEKMTPDDIREYVHFVATMRHNQNRWFRLRNFDALKIAQEMERKIDEFNAQALDPQPRLL